MAQVVTIERHRERERERDLEHQSVFTCELDWHTAWQWHYVTITNGNVNHTLWSCAFPVYKTSDHANSNFHKCHYKNAVSFRALSRKSKLAFLKNKFQNISGKAF
jgi:hypothetical protein